MATDLCQPAVALRSRNDDGIGWFIWFLLVLLAFLLFFCFLVYRFYWLPRKKASEAPLPSHEWRPTTLRWSDMTPGTMQAPYTIPKTSTLQLPHSSSIQGTTINYPSQGPPVVIIPPDMDFTKSPSPHPVVPYSPQPPYRVQYAELSPYPAGIEGQRPSYNVNTTVSADPPHPYEAVAVRTTTTTRRTTVLSPQSQSRITTIV